MDTEHPRPDGRHALEPDRDSPERRRSQQAQCRGEAARRHHAGRRDLPGTHLRRGRSHRAGAPRRRLRGEQFLEVLRHDWLATGLAGRTIMSAKSRSWHSIFHFTIDPGAACALAAFEPATLALLEETRSIFRDRRDLLLPALQELGMRIETEPQGAFYIYADVSALADNAEELAAPAGGGVRPLHQAPTSAIIGRMNTCELPIRPHQRLEEAVERMRRILHR